jgi:hypothetical protein
MGVRARLKEGSAAAGRSRDWQMISEGMVHKGVTPAARAFFFFFFFFFFF